MYSLTFYFQEVLKFQVSWGCDFLCVDLHFQLYYTVCITLKHCGLQQNNKFFWDAQGSFIYAHEASQKAKHLRKCIKQWQL